MDQLILYFARKIVTDLCKIILGLSSFVFLCFLQFLQSSFSILVVLFAFKIYR